MEKLEKKFEGWPVYKEMKTIANGCCQCQKCQNIRQFFQDLESGVSTYATEQEMTMALIEKYPDQFQLIKLTIMEINLDDDLTNNTVQREDLRQLFDRLDNPKKFDNKNR
ncbi:MAG TPA: hypothetical protein HA283_01130 [Nanoarchaeota archaeon]|nr:hypothetical protein [Nanoarchaeota archaeon]HIH62875.1 hypothetical protein [Nanoarchaeota archaeon]HIJ10292.1 hypothetical protein [Nanoarchaeota archaeon]